MKLPQWLIDRINQLKKTGKLKLIEQKNLNNSHFLSIDLKKILILIKELDLSKTDLSSLNGLPILPNIKIFIADNSKISTFENFIVLNNINKISLKNTPISKKKNYLLNLYILFKNSLVSIDNKCICSKIKKNSELYHPICKELINLGWNLTNIPPNYQEIEELCTQYNIFLNKDLILEEEEEEDIEIPEINFNNLIFKHEKIQNKYLKKFEILSNNNDFENKLINLFSFYNIKINKNENLILKNIEKILKM